MAVLGRALAEQPRVGVARSVLVTRAGPQTSVQQWPGRLGYWSVGVPASGPMDSYAFRVANLIVGNSSEATGLEFALQGPRLRFDSDATVAIAGAPVDATLDGERVVGWDAIDVPAGAKLELGRVRGPGMRAYLAVRGGLGGDTHLGSAATFMLGGFGGYHGRALAAGDRLKVGDAITASRRTRFDLRVEYTEQWELHISAGPQGAPEHFDRDDLDSLLAELWTVHHQSDRTGIRLLGRAPAWPRRDGGDAGLHPSNIHDNAYALGAITFAGDQPLIIGVDGPSLGGFVSPACVVGADHWKLGQLRPGDRVRFVTVSVAAARGLAQAQESRLAGMRASTPARIAAVSEGTRRTLGSATVLSDGTPVSLLAAGESNVLVELGAAELDLCNRVHVRELTARLRREGLAGIIDLTEGVRTLQVHFDSEQLEPRRLLSCLEALAAELPAPDDVEIPVRTVHLPLSWDDPAAQDAVDRYAANVRADAPWCPSNLEFLRRINGLESVDEVRQIVFGAAYMVLGLGDVYLGAPVALPLDPRHRLLSTKYTPPRTWTPQNAVGLGGTYMCIYGMEGPGGYQLVGRTLPVWDARGRGTDFRRGEPWLLRPFDQIRFEPVGAGELLGLRESFLDGGYGLRICEHTFSLRAHNEFLERHRRSIDASLAGRRAAFDAERARWAAGPA